MIAKTPTTQDNLWVAAGDGQLDRVKELVESGVDVNSHDQFGYTAMHAAVSYGQLDIVKYLLEKGANVNIEDFEKDTPLYVAETVEMAQLLLDHGADPKTVNEEGLSPAATAFEEGYEDVAELLADITKEELPTRDEETGALIHVQDAEDEARAEEAADAAEEAEAEEEAEMSQELSDQMEAIMKRIEEQGGVENEEELREMVTKMVIDGMKRNLEQNQ